MNRTKLPLRSLRTATLCLLAASMLTAQRGPAAPQGRWKFENGTTGQLSFTGYLRSDTVDVEVSCSPSKLVLGIKELDNRLEFRRVPRTALNGPGVTIAETLDGKVAYFQTSSPASNFISLTLTHFRNDFTAQAEARKTVLQKAEDVDLQVSAIDAVLHARTITFKLPLSNGNDLVVDLQPGDDAFRQLASRCATYVRRPPDRPSSLPSQQRFTGTADEFAMRLPEFLRQVSAGIGLDPARYQKESQFVVDAVKTCAQLTVSMAVGMEAGNPTGMPRQGDGGRYSLCYQGAVLVSRNVSPRGPGEREITLLITPTVRDFKTPPKSWTDGDQFSVIVFYTLDAEHPLNSAGQGANMIVSAKIDRAK